MSSEREMIEFLFPYAERGFDLEANKYPGPLFMFKAIREYIECTPKSKELGTDTQQPQAVRDANADGTAS